MYERYVVQAASLKEIKVSIGPATYDRQCRYTVQTRSGEFARLICLHVFHLIAKMVRVDVTLQRMPVHWRIHAPIVHSRNVTLTHARTHARMHVVGA